MLVHTHTQHKHTHKVSETMKSEREKKETIRKTKRNERAIYIHEQMICTNSRYTTTTTMTTTEKDYIKRGIYLYRNFCVQNK